MGDCSVSPLSLIKIWMLIIQVFIADAQNGGVNLNAEIYSYDLMDLAIPEDNIRTDGTICSGSGGSSETITCPGNSRIYLTSAVYGVREDSNARHCRQMPLDCIEDASGRLAECMNAQQCEVRNGGRYLAECDAYSDYLDINYICIRNNINGYTMCEEHDTTESDSPASHGFLFSPLYPEEYPARQYCECNVFTQTGGRVLFQALDFRLEGRIGDCYDDLSLYDPNSGRSTGKICDAILRNSTLYGAEMNHITFTSDRDVQQRGFWTYFFGVSETGDAAPVWVECSDIESYSGFGSGIGSGWSGSGSGFGSGVGSTTTTTPTASTTTTTTPTPSTTTTTTTTHSTPTTTTPTPSTTTTTILPFTVKPSTKLPTTTTTSSQPPPSPSTPSTPTSQQTASATDGNDRNPTEGVAQTSDGTNSALIIGAAAGGAALVTLVVVAVVASCLCRRRPSSPAVIKSQPSIVRPERDGDYATLQHRGPVIPPIYNTMETFKEQDPTQITEVYEEIAIDDTHHDNPCYGTSPVSISSNRGPLPSTPRSDSADPATGSAYANTTPYENMNPVQDNDYLDM